MKIVKTLSAASILIALTTSCAQLSAMKFIEFRKQKTNYDALDRTSKMDIKTFLNGELEGFGASFDKFDHISAAHTVKINAKWEDSKGVLNYSVTSLNGVKDIRTWLISLNTDGSFTGVGHDIAGPAQGRQFGNASYLEYDLLLPNPNTGLKEKVSFQEKIYLIDDNSAIMISNFKTNSGDDGKIVTSLKKPDFKAKVNPKSDAKSDKD